MTLLARTVLRYLVILAGMAGIIWLFYAKAIVPFHQRAEAFELRRSELQERISSGRLKLIGIKDAEQKLGLARAGLSRLVGDNSGEPALVAFPADVAYHFSQLGFPDAIVRFATAEKEPG